MLTEKQFIKCFGNRVKISKNSITVKNNDGKTIGVIKNTQKLNDLQPNKLFHFSSIMRKQGVDPMQLGLGKIIVYGDNLIVFRDMSLKDFVDKYGFEEEKLIKEERMYVDVKEKGYTVIECYLI